MQKLVALKVLHRQTSENAEVVSRFEREAVAAGRVAHPNVAGATDFGRLADGSFYLVLEYVQGKSLGELIREEGALPLERALAIAKQIAAALAAAHQAGIVHRDLKPENVMLVASSETPPAPGTGGRGTLPTMTDEDRVKVLDFGLAKLQKTDAADTQLTMVGAVYGTPQYMSPEQAAGQEVDHRADLYALGLILYEMLVGRPPFTSEQMMPLLLLQMTEPAPALPAEVPKGVRKLVAKLLLKKPEERFQSADEVLTALEEATPSSNRPPQRSVVAVPLPTLPTIPEVRSSLGRFGVTVQRVSGPALASARTYLKGSTELRGHVVPRWWIASGLSLALVGALLAVSLTGSGEEGEGAQATAEKEMSGESADPVDRDADIDPELRKVIAAANRGSDAALYALEQRDDDDRTATEWMALSRARLMRKDVEESLDAFREAMELEPSVADDRMLLGALRFLADDEKYAETIMNFVMEELGSTAPDFLFDVWSRTSAKTPSTKLAWELLNTSEMRELYSPSLKIALALRRVETCEARIELLPQVIEDADERSMLILAGMKKDEDCAERAGDQLDEAITQASMRKSPKFPFLKSFQFK